MKTYTLVLVFFTISAFSQTPSSRQTNIKKFTFGALPTILYNSDIGFQYGALVNFFWYGDQGARYPHFDNSLYVEFSRTTRGNQIIQTRWDARRLIPNARLLLDFQYFISRANPFYGFNGYSSKYDSDLEDSDLPNYISEMFYRYDHRNTHLKMNFQKNLQGKRLRVLAELTWQDISTNPVDVDHLNKGRKDEDKYPDVPGLYQNYMDWGVLPHDQKRGGNHAFLKIGGILDTRDIEANPNYGLYEEAAFTIAPSFLGFDETILQLDLTHRHYLSLIKDRLTFAYRLKYETSLSGTMPWYIMEGIGGGKTVRGLLYNRLRGDGMVFGNFEFRWKVLKTILWNQNIYIALNPFVDTGRVTDPYKLNLDHVPVEHRSSLEYTNESWHFGYGIGARCAINENFILAMDYGMASDKQDGTSGIYIDLNYLF